MINPHQTCAVRFELSRSPEWCELLTLDPGAKKAGVAWWRWQPGLPETARLIDATTLRAARDDKLPRVIYRWAVNRLVAHDGMLGRSFYKVGEEPRAYGTKRLFHKDLERLAKSLKALEQLWGPWDLLLFPHAWKGGVGSTLKPGGKAPHHRRLRQALDPAEQVLFDKAGPDGKDAVGIGLFVLGRTGRGGTKCAL